MAREALHVTVRKRDDMAILDLNGEIDGSGDEALTSAFGNARALRPARILLNFARVDYMNSTGIALIVTLLSQARRDRVPLLVCGLSEHYQEIFRITRLSDFMPHFPDEQAALRG